MSDDLFKCKQCGEVKDKDEKNGITFSKWSTKASARTALCDHCFTNFVNTIPFQLGDWKEWPKRSKGD